MRTLLVATLLLAGCRGEPAEHHKPPATTHIASSGVTVPTLPLSPDGVNELHMLDKRIQIHDDDPGTMLAFLAQRTAARGRLEDYQTALARTADWVAKAPTNPDAWLARARALSAVHDFAGARTAIAHAPGPGADAEAIALDEATGHRDRSLPARAELARIAPTPATITQYAASLALAGKFDEARAQIPKAVAMVADNAPSLFTWLYFQWGRIYEQEGDLATARKFYEASRTRMPNIEVTAHLALAELGTGDKDAAKRLVQETLQTDPHPSILELGVPMGLVPLADAKAAWERYVAALPLAFADHAARFYLGAGADPARALVLARQNLANRDTPEARALVVEAALAAGDPTAACAIVDPLLVAPQRADRFTAWKALSRCGRTGDADRLGKDLGIAP